MLFFKGGIVIFDLIKVIDEFKVGKLEFRVDWSGIVYVMFGKIFFLVEDLLINLKVL